MKVVIETERLILREYEQDDFDALFEIMSDAETMQHYPAPFDGELLPEIGCHINKKYWRRGFAKEAARACRNWAFSNV